jgi:hypothetical protein
VIKNYTTGPTDEPYSVSIPLSSYQLGSYTLTVKAITNTGVIGQNTINFSVQDKIPPTISADVTSAPKWTTFPVSVNVTADDTGGSGYRGFRYAITNSTAYPSSWSSINPSKTGTISVNVSGQDYLHLESYDNIGNVTYLRTGIYYIDVDPPAFTFSEPAKWQQNGLNLGVTVSDASNIVTKKWMQGNATIDQIKASGTDLTTTSIPISSNGVYSFYAIDENNQETLTTYNVSNINFTPTLQSAPSKILIPSTSKLNFSVDTTFSHADNGDPTQLVTDLGSSVLNSSNVNTSSGTNQPMTWNTDYSSLTENTLYNGNLYLKDSQSGISNKISTQVEVYNPSLTLKSKVSGMNISWTDSKLSQNYRLLRDGEVIYTGANPNYFDAGVTYNTQYSYTLQVLLNGNYISVASLNKTSGYNLFETPTSINFPSVALGSNSPITPSSIDLSYVKYQDLSDVITPYSLDVSITNFSSPQSSFTANSFVLTNVKKLDHTNAVIKTLPDIYVSNTPVELVNQSETTTDSYTKLEVLQNDIELSIPNTLILNSGSGENFNATLVWNITYAP